MTGITMDAPGARLTPFEDGQLRRLFFFESAGAALAASEAADEQIDAVVVDQVMPGLTGIETARRLRRQKFDRPIILCSGHIGAELASPIKRLNLIPCNKIDIDALVRIVQTAV